jgi:hypothetical protein
MGICHCLFGSAYKKRCKWCSWNHLRRWYLLVFHVLDVSSLEMLEPWLHGVFPVICLLGALKPNYGFSRWWLKVLWLRAIVRGRRNLPCRSRCWRDFIVVGIYSTASSFVPAEYVNIFSLLVFLCCGWISFDLEMQATTFNQSIFYLHGKMVFS